MGRSPAAAPPPPASSAGASATASNEGGNGLLFEACHEVLAQLELLCVMLAYVGKGHFCFVAGVCKEWKANYAASYPAGKTGYSSVVSSVQCVNWATTDQQDLELSVQLFKAAAQYGNVEVCKALHGKNCPWDGDVCGDVCEAAAKNRKHGLTVLKWLRSEGLPDKEQCPWYGTGYAMCVCAVEEGHLEMLQWLLSEEGNADFRSVSWAHACAGGHVPVVEWLLEHPPTRALLEQNEDGYWRKGAYFAADEGRLEVLQFLYASARHLCHWDAEVCMKAVLNSKSLAVLKWLRSEEVQCAWDEMSCPQVIRDTVLGEPNLEEWDIDAKDFEEIKQWVHANGHPCDCQD